MVSTYSTYDPFRSILCSCTMERRARGHSHLIRTRFAGGGRTVATRRPEEVSRPGVAQPALPNQANDLAKLVTILGGELIVG